MAGCVPGELEGARAIPILIARVRNHPQFLFFVCSVLTAVRGSSRRTVRSVFRATCREKGEGGDTNSQRGQRASASPASPFCPSQPHHSPDSFGSDWMMSSSPSAIGWRHGGGWAPGTPTITGTAPLNGAQAHYPHPALYQPFPTQPPPFWFPQRHAMSRDQVVWATGQLGPQGGMGAWGGARSFPTPPDGLQAARYHAPAIHAPYSGPVFGTPTSARNFNPPSERDPVETVLLPTQPTRQRASGREPRAAASPTPLPHPSTESTPKVSSVPPADSSPSPDVLGEAEAVGPAESDSEPSREASPEASPSPEPAVAADPPPRSRGRPKKKAKGKGKSRNCHPTPCPDCGRVFNSASNLKRHQRVHTGERPYMCINCNKPFANSSNRNKHILVCERRLAQGKSIEVYPVPHPSAPRAPLRSATPTTSGRRGLRPRPNSTLDIVQTPSQRTQTDPNDSPAAPHSVSPAVSSAVSASDAAGPALAAMDTDEAHSGRSNSPDWQATGGEYDEGEDAEIAETVDVIVERRGFVETRSVGIQTAT
eukprot:m.319960 g.319960  ORF g.319960 m.319960 type:complete len:538 (+) comp16448_c0_seq24:2306-3919(+)